MTDLAQQIKALAEERALEIERDIRIALWNTGRWQGRTQEVAQSFIQHAMEEPTMKRAMANILTALSEAERMREALRLCPEAHDVLTAQEMRDAKGNWRSLIDQQTNAIRAAIGGE